MFSYLLSERRSTADRSSIPKLGCTFKITWGDFKHYNALTSGVRITGDGMQASALFEALTDFKA